MTLMRTGKSRRLQSDERPCKKKKQDTRSQRLRRQQNTVKCKNCGGLGHNSKTCHRRASNEEAVMGSHIVQAPQDDRGGSNMSRDDGGGSSSVHITKKQKNHPTLLPPRGGCQFFDWEDPPICRRSRAIIPGLLRRVLHCCFS
ncbi:gag-pol polyprotein [Striga asiatica]|uniref:Gag-pol polyprotein n=1 Tax=Striga asiatica TaxID=4170 RepID=A0A5A7Q2E6_STRAF|nr:gag-pol polyprotein [Striga asiatica]